MSALLSIGEADRAILIADAEIKSVAIGVGNGSLRHAQEQLAEARATLGAVRYALRTQAIFDALKYHEGMASCFRQGAIAQRVFPGRGLHAEADRHAAFARALRTLVGTVETPAAAGGEGHHGA